jgi:hypothetical protein
MSHEGVKALIEKYLGHIDKLEAEMRNIKVSKMSKYDMNMKINIRSGAIAILESVVADLVVMDRQMGNLGEELQ